MKILSCNMQCSDLTESIHLKLFHSSVCVSLTVVPEAPALWLPGLSSLVGCCSVAPPVGPLASCSQFQCSLAGTHEVAQAPQDNPGNTQHDE